jgi:protein-L-isoaspartate(D-aspartate) O-methyltransferase
VSAEDPRSTERAAMVGQLHLGDARIAAAMRAVPRHAFVPRESAEFAYADEPLSLGFGEATISAPHMVALMLEASDLRAGERVMEIGGGMGYFAAVAAELVGRAGHIYTIELDAALAREATRRLGAEGFADRVTVFAQDGAPGLPELAPFDAVIVSCAAPEILPTWQAQVRDGGRIVAPVGDRWEQVLLTWTRSGRGGSVRKGPACRFVPLRRATTPHI